MIEQKILIHTYHKGTSNEAALPVGERQAAVGTEKIGLLTENPENLEVHFMLNSVVSS